MKYKKGIAALLVMTMLMLICTPFSLAASINSHSIVGTTWYGEFTSYFSSKSETFPVAMNITIDSCDENGEFEATGYTYAVTGYGYDGLWYRQRMEGKIDFSNGSFELHGVEVINQNPRPGKTFLPDPPFKGTIDDNNMTGLFAETFEFNFARTSDWAKDEITEAEAVGLIPETIIGSDMTQPVTRGEFAAVAVKLYEQLTGAEVTAYDENKFTDISGDKNETYIKKAYAANITVGVSDSEFEPSAKLTREQMSTMLTRVIKKFKFDGWTYETDGEYYLDTSGTKIFADDALISDWAKPSVYYLYKMGIVNGVDDKPSFAPRAETPEQEANDYATATREQAILLSLRVFKISDII